MVVGSMEDSLFFLPRSSTTSTPMTLFGRKSPWSVLRARATCQPTFTAVFGTPSIHSVTRTIWNTRGTQGRHRGRHGNEFLQRNTRSRVLTPGPVGGMSAALLHQSDEANVLRAHQWWF